MKSRKVPGFLSTIPDNLVKERTVVPLASLVQGENKDRAVWCRVVRMVSDDKGIPQYVLLVMMV